MPAAERNQMVAYHDLTSNNLNEISFHDAVALTINLIAQRARVRGGGKILSWGDFNENPDPLINRLLAQILVAQIDPNQLRGLQARKMAVMSIENSAGYLASEVAHVVADNYQLSRPPRIIRARKTSDGTPPSPAMGEILQVVHVTPITSHGQTRHLIASMPDLTDLSEIRFIFAVDDFRATGDTLRGGVDLGIGLLTQAGVNPNEITVFPMAGLGKPEQEEQIAYAHTDSDIKPVLTAVNVNFWPDQVSGKAYIQTGGFEPIEMKLARAADFGDIK